MKKLFTLFCLLTFVSYVFAQSNITMSSSGNYTQCSGNFYDGGGPSNDYPNNQDVTITIYPSTGNFAQTDPTFPRETDPSIPEQTDPSISE